MDYQTVIEIVDHRVNLWVQLLEYAEQEIEVTDPASHVEINLRPHHDRRVVSIPTITVKFEEPLPLEELSLIALNLISYLAESALEAFCDYHVCIEFNDVDHTFVISFNDYNIRT